jgi:hypothetical protein
MKPAIAFLTVLFVCMAAFGQSGLQQPQPYSADLSKLSPRQFLSLLKYSSDTAKGVKWVTVSNTSPDGWVTLQDVRYLMSVIHSKEKCKCVIKVYSSYLPVDDFSTVGGQAMNLIDSYRTQQPYCDRPWDCEKTDSARITRLEKWWKELNTR